MLTAMDPFFRVNSYFDIGGGTENRSFTATGAGPGLHADDDPKPLFWKAVHWELGKFYRKKPKVELVPLGEVEDELYARDGIECLEVGIDFDRALVPFDDREREVLVKVLSEDWTTREIAAVYRERGQSNWSRWLKYKAHPRLREVVFEGAAA